MAKYTLSQIKSHPDFPFADFESNPLSFLMLELYWAQLFAELMKDNAGDWKSLRKAEMDGNPIFSTTSLALKRQLTVIHKINTNNKPAYPAFVGEGTYYGLQAWLNNGYTADGETPLNELVLYADLSAETEKEAIKFIRSHCLELVDGETMQQNINDYEDRIQMPE